MTTVLDVRRLLVLRAVAQHGSLAAAARALGYSQPAVSHHIHRLEAETGVRLVIRDGRRPPAGRRAALTGIPSRPRGRSPLPV
jgi:molybdate transport repressor ModE-like protein